MKTVTIAFDIDGTLRDNTEQSYCKPNERIVALLMALHHMKNTRIIAWSGGGAEYAEQCIREMGLEKYFKGYYSKLQTQSDPWGVQKYPPIKEKVDIAIDDIQECSLGVVNLIVREK